MVDTQNLAALPIYILNTFNVTTSNSYSYYRLIINKIFNGDVAQLGRWNLNGSPILGSGMSSGMSSG
jgi:hypothetical protein